MKYTRPATVVICMFFFSACAMFEAKEPTPTHVAPKILSVPVGKNWQVVEEAPNLTNERNERPAFQTEQSLQPEGIQRPARPTEQRKIETPAN